MRAFTITIGHRDAPRLSFAAMAPDSATAFDQHVDLAEVGERVEVQLAQRTEEIVQRALEKRRQAIAAEQAARERTANAYRKWDEARRATPARDADGYGSYGMSCARCGGTPSGDSVHGYVGKCSCGSVR